MIFYCIKKKLGGILVESLTSSAYPSLFVIGIGVNTKTPTFTGCEAIGCNITNRNQLFAYLLDALYLALIKLSEEGFKVFQQAWEGHCVHLNQVVDLLIPHTPLIRGIFKGIDQQGALILEAEGETTTYQMGEISLRTTKCSY